MDIENRSHTPAKHFRHIVDWMVRRFGHSYMTCLVVLDSVRRDATGHAYKRNPEPKAIRTVCPSVVKLMVPAPHLDGYPKKLPEHVPEVGPVSVHSWTEEIVYVLAHELQHVEDFWAKRFTHDQVHEAEVSAEREARAALLAWRHEHARVMA